MDRETLLLVAVVMLSLAALAVGVSGWVLLARESRLRHSLAPATGSATGHHEVPEER
jgi:hypothetical protein